MVRKKLDALRKTESEIFIFGTRDSSYVAASLLWSLGRSPTAFITNSKQELDSSRFGIPILTPTAALAGRISPIIFICSYNQKTSGQWGAGFLSAFRPLLLFRSPEG